MLGFTDLTENPVVQNKNFNGQLFSVHGFKLLNIHLKSAVARYAVNGFLIFRYAGAYGKR